MIDFKRVNKYMSDLRWGLCLCLKHAKNLFQHTPFLTIPHLKPEIIDKDIVKYFLHKQFLKILFFPSRLFLVRFYTTGLHNGTGNSTVLIGFLSTEFLQCFEIKSDWPSRKSKILSVS